MGYELRTKARFLGGDLHAKAKLGPIYKEVVAPDEYTGATTITPSDDTQTIPTKDKLVRDDITVNPAPEPVLEMLTVDSLTQQGTFLPAGDGFSQVTVEEDWDGTLYPVTDDPDKVFDAKWIPVRDGDTIIVEGYGRGRWVGTNGNNKIDPNTLETTFNFSALPSPFFSKIRFTFTIKTLADDACIILAGYQWTKDGTHSANSAYQFRGEYMKWKVIHAS